MDPARYRPDIDGLRAIAVLAVVFFHVGFATFQGGFVGVDVFFVISGFLITRLIRDEMADHRFSFANFYVRRARRLFPALYFTLWLCLIAAFALFSPEHMARFGGALLHAVLSVANFYFWSESGYFDIESPFKPLLHTWSLSVEEQFYLVWPLLLLGLLTRASRWFAPLFIAVAGLVSLYAAQRWIASDPAGAFYLAPFRINEFAIGALMVWGVEHQPRNRLVLEPIVPAGLGLIAYSVLTYSQETPFPGIHAMLPCLGTALLIYGGTAKYAGVVLRNRVSVGIGLISYSLYLVHWPILVFYRYYEYDEPSRLEMYLVVVVSLAAAGLMYRYVEMPYRRPGQARRRYSAPAFGFACSMLALLVAFPAAHSWATRGWDWRVPSVSPPAELVNELSQFAEPWHRDARIEVADGSVAVWGVGSQLPDAQKVLLLGDSHAQQLTHLADYLGKKYNLNVTIYVATGCPPLFGTFKVFGPPGGIENPPPRQRLCRKMTQVWEDHVESGGYDVVMLASRWMWLYEPPEYGEYHIRNELLVARDAPEYSVAASRAVFEKYLPETVRAIRATGARVVVFSQVPHQGAPLEGCDNAPRFLFSASGLAGRCHVVSKALALERLAFTDRLVEGLARIDGVDAVIPSRYYCDNDGERCRLFDAGVRLFRNSNHINPRGALYLARRWEADPEFPFR